MFLNPIDNNYSFTSGIFNVPFVGEIILHKGAVIAKIGFTYENNLYESSQAYASSLREKQVSMYTTNTHHFGHLVERANYSLKVARPEIFEIMSNLQDWTARYIHPDYHTYLQNISQIQEVKSYIHSQS